MDDSDGKLFFVERAKTGRAKCKRCKDKCDSGELRIAKFVPNAFSDGGLMKQWFHLNCLFESFKTARATTKKIDSVDDIGGWDELSEDDKDIVLDKLNTIAGISPPKKVKNELFKATTSKIDENPEPKNKTFDENSDDNLFQTFQNVCEKIASESGYNKKSEILQKFLIKGSNKDIFKGDIYLWMKLLLPSAIRRVYNLQSKQLVKLFSKVFRTDHNDMLIDLEQGDVSETLRKYFEESEKIKSKKVSSLTMQEVDTFLDELKDLTKEDDQIEAFLRFCRKATSNDLKMVIRLIKHDLKINAGARHILDALDAQAYPTFQLSRDLKMVVNKFGSTIGKNKIASKDINILKGVAGGSGSIKSGATVQLMSPISPMLAEACKSVEKAIAKNPEGMFSEIKYDGERVQIHKSGTEFRFYTRNLKPVLDHKIARCKEFIPKAFPSGHDMILDSEILVVNTQTGELLPFGTLGVHKREQFANSEVCLFVFDCIYFNGEDLTKRTIKERKKILENNIQPIKNHVQLSEYYPIKNVAELATMTAKVLKAGLEGLVLKNVTSLYQPGKRGWLKIKKDYLFEGQMADSADLVVLGAWFGTGKKGGMLSIFLMGSYDPNLKIWKTVTKVHSGLDDPTMESLQNELNMLMERCNSKKLPKWLSFSKNLIPDFIAKDPFKMPVWEITGAEFTKSEAHGISIRFPRITKFRDDKSPKEATNIEELQVLYDNSKDNVNVDMLFKGLGNSNDDSTDSKVGISIKTKLYDIAKDDSTSTSNDNDSSFEVKKEIESDSDENKRDIKLVKMEVDEDVVKDKKVFKKEYDEDVKDKKIFKKEYDEDLKHNQMFKKEYDEDCLKLFQMEYEEDVVKGGRKRKSEKIDEISIPDSKKKTYDKKHSQKETETIVSSKVKKLKDEKVNKFFENISIFIKPDVNGKLKEEYINLYKKFGGSITNETKKANYILHSINVMNENTLKEIRKLYNPTSKHLTYKWLEECIKNEKLINDYKWYAVNI